MNRPKARAPKRKDDRIILHFDYDCFYASVFENQNPALKSLPLGVKQKSILATANYVARSRGVKKLTSISEAKRVCPDLVIINGENLSPFRDASKRLFSCFRSFSWNDKIERLGLDEVFMDVTDIIDYNVFCLNKTSLSDSFFSLSKTDPERGFPCDLTRFAGHVKGHVPDVHLLDNLTYTRLLLGSHLALHLREKIEHDFGFTCTCGISTNKLLSKVVGSQHKPRNQTTLLALDREAVISFIDEQPIRMIPGIGHKMVQLLQSHIRPDKPSAGAHSIDAPEDDFWAREVRTHPDMSAASLEDILGRAGAERGVGEKVWGLLHGVDSTEVKGARDVPTQISIEDTYRTLDNLPQITLELEKLSESLIRRMRIDLVAEDDNPHRPGNRRWIAHPKTLRLSIGPRFTQLSDGYNFSRSSRSQPLPTFVFSLEEDIPSLARRLVAEAALPLLRKFQSGKDHEWDLSLLNVCVANMALVANDTGAGVGRDISVMFKTQEETLRPWKVETVTERPNSTGGPEEQDDEQDSWDMSWEDDGAVEKCHQCGHNIPLFAISAHARFHELGD